MEKGGSVKPENYVTKHSKLRDLFRIRYSYGRVTNEDDALERSNLVKSNLIYPVANDVRGGPAIQAIASVCM